MNGDRAFSSVKTVVKYLALAWYFGMTLAVFSLQPALAQNADTVGPIIELEELAQADADLTQVFTVLIAEDVQLRDATLYYRRQGQLPFTPAPMAALSDTGYYSVSVPTDETDLRTIEYYVQARDNAGNRTVSGFAFDPYQRQLQASSKIEVITQTEATTVQPSSAATEQPQIPSILNERWARIALGVVVAGLITSLASSGGGSDTEVVPLTFNLQ